MWIKENLSFNPTNLSTTMFCIYANIIWEKPYGWSGQLNSWTDFMAIIL